MTTTSEWQAADAAHFLHPFTDHAALAGKGSRVIERGENIYVWDTDGKRMLDGMSGLWCVNVGYGREELIKAAEAQMRKLAFYNAFFQTTTTPAVELAQKIASLAPQGFEHVFFTSSGSEGNDTIVRLVRRYWDIEGQPQRQVIIGRRNGYHGSTMAGASLGGMSDMHAQGGLPIPGVAHIEQPHWFELAHEGETREQFGLRAARWLDDKINEIGADKVAAFIGEPVQGAGGVIVPPSTYWPEIERICRRHGILLVSDEVICGFGRTGRWFGCDTFAYQPDLITFAKGVTSGYVPLGGVLIGERVARALIDRGGEFAHGYTYSGHPVACATALANLEVIEREQLVARVRDETGPHLAKRFQELAKHPLVGEWQSCGLMGALQLVKSREPRVKFDADKSVGMLCRSFCFDNGLIMRAVGDRMIVAPPLVITVAQIDELAGLIERVLELTDAALRQRGWLG